MSEEEKQMFNKMIYCNLINGEQALKFNRKYKDLQQKVEQLEKENKELKQPQVYIDCENMEERYGRDLYEDYLKEKIEQLEKENKILKEDNVFLKNNLSKLSKKYIKNDLLNILNKGE